MTIPVILGVATLVFSLIHLVPGDPAQSMLGESAAPADVNELRARLGLDRPVVTQYVEYLTRALRGDLGTSFRYGTPVTREIGARLGSALDDHVTIEDIHVRGGQHDGRKRKDRDGHEDLDEREALAG